MRTNFTPFTEALNHLVTAALSLYTNLLAQANQERMELLDLRDRMTATHLDMQELASILGGTADELGAMSDEMDGIASLVHEVLEGEPAPDCDYQDFIGFCETCGELITIDDERTETEDGVICAACASASDETESDD